MKIFYVENPFRLMEGGGVGSTMLHLSVQICHITLLTLIGPLRALSPAFNFSKTVSNLFLLFLTFYPEYVNNIFSREFSKQPRNYGAGHLSVSL
jgi:hypothetical protein